MLIQDFVQVPLPYLQVAGQLTANPRAFLQQSAIDAYREGEDLSMRVGVSAHHRRLGKKVSLDVGTPFPRHDGLVIPICWWATGAAWLFPCLDGDLSIVPLGRDSTQLTLMGRYEPPLAKIGHGIDRLVLHRVAEASVRAFLMQIAQTLGELQLQSPANQQPAINQ